MRSVCHELGLSVKTIQRWRKPGGGEDGRHGPRTVPANKLSVEERQEILETVNSADIDGLFGDVELMDLPERANEALDNLGQIYAMTRGIIDLLE